MKILSTNIEGFDRIIVVFTVPGFIITSIFIILGHIIAYQQWSILLVSWNPSKVSNFAGIIYLFLLTCSVIVHELGHLANAVYNRERLVEIHIQFKYWLPTFMTRHIKDATFQKPLLNLAGFYSQLAFASSLGILYFFTHDIMLPASILLIDIGALASLVPVRGADGYWFFMDTISEKNARKEKVLNSITLKISLFLFSFSYIIMSLILFIGVVYQWVNGYLTKNVSYEVFGYLTLLIPAIIYGIWAIKILNRTNIKKVIIHIFHKLKY